MTWAAAGLVLTAAFLNAGWNLLMKRARGGTAFVWLVGLLSTVLYMPVAAWVVISRRPDIGPAEVGLLAVGSTFHVAYYLLLDRGYRVGDLSLIYPLVRGTGPLLCTLFAMIALGERPSAIALLGTVLVAGGIVFIAGNTLAWIRGGALKPLLFALACGVIVGTYTVWDKVVISIYLVPPLLLAWFSEFWRSVVLSPYAVRNWPQIKEQWAGNRKAIIGVALLCPLGYILILTAMSFSPVSYVAPLREFSILIGAIMGTRLLSEGDAKVRIAGAGAMVAGLVALTMG